jgi:hypothetical protein
MDEREAARAAVREFLTTRRARVTPAVTPQPGSPESDAVRLLASWNAGDEQQASAQEKPAAGDDRWRSRPAR